MRHRWTDVRDALQRAQRFFNETAGLLSEAVDLTAARKWLDELVRLTLRETPEFHAFRMPKLAVRGWELIAHARVTAEVAAIYKDVFFKHGLPSSFLDDFESAITKLEESVREREHNLLRRTNATHELALAAKRGRVVLTVLDALVRQATRDNESLLRAWESARAIRRKPVSEPTSTAA